MKPETHPTPAALDEPSTSSLHRERGSAYLAVLMLLVVLTILGLSLSVVTQTEVFIGSSDKQAARQLFAADSGYHVATAYQLTDNASPARRFTLAARDESFFGQTVRIGDRICTTPYTAIQFGRCNLCSINEKDFFSVQYAATANALRHGDDSLAARKAIGAVLSVEPTRLDSRGQSTTSSSRLVEDGSIGSSSSPEIDPCEDLHLKI